MPAPEDNVVQMPLVRLAQQIKNALAGQRNGRATWKVASFDLCLALAEARREFAGNVEFGEWFDRTIGKDQMNHQDRAAAIAMGREPDALRKTLDATERASLQLIYANDFPRFTSASKTPRKKGSGHRKNPERDRQAEIMFENGATEPEVVAATGIDRHSANTIHRIVDARREEREKLQQTENQTLTTTEARLSDKSKLTLANAIRIHKTRLDKSFDQTVNAEVRRRIDTADDYARKRLKDVERQLFEFERERGKKGVFSKGEFRQLQMVCHPDNSASAEMRARMLDLITKNKDRLINPDKP